MGGPLGSARHAAHLKVVGQDKLGVRVGQLLLQEDLGHLAHHFLNLAACGVIPDELGVLVRVLDRRHRTRIPHMLHASSF